MLFVVFILAVVFLVDQANRSSLRRQTGSRLHYGPEQKRRSH
jgi:hypothetical protein